MEGEQKVLRTSEREDTETNRKHTTKHTHMKD